jgi:hypothetical protein
MSLKIFIAYFIVITALTCCIKPKDDKLEEKATKKYDGLYKVTMLTTTDYDTTNGSVKATLATANAGEVEMGVDTDGLGFNKFRYKIIVQTRLMRSIELASCFTREADNSLSCYWLPDFAARRLLIYGLCASSRYEQVNIEQPDKKHLQFTYIQATTGWDGGTGSGTTMKGKEVWMLEKQ